MSKCCDNSTGCCEPNEKQSNCCGEQEKASGCCDDKQVQSGCGCGDKQGEDGCGGCGSQAITKGSWENVPYDVVAASCPECFSGCDPVEESAMKSLLNDDVLDRVTDETYFACTDEACDVVYFALDSDTIFKKYSLKNQD